MRTFAVIHGTVQTASCAPDGLAALAAQNRGRFLGEIETLLVGCDLNSLRVFRLGITMGSSLRKKPNAFNLLHQARLVSAFGAEKFEKAMFVLVFSCALQVQFATPCV